MKGGHTLTFVLALMMSGLGFTLAWLMHRSAPVVLPGKPHHTTGGFRNVYGSKSTSFLDFLTWRWERLWKEKPLADAGEVPLLPQASEFLQSHGNANTATWIGHATVLLRLEGKNILTDPHFSQRASPVQFAGPRRVAAPGLSLEKLPAIHAVVISHDHYDSLDRNTIVRLYEREGGKRTVFFVPLGLKRWFAGLGINNVVEMDWWEEESRFGMQFVCVPVHHWSQRVPFVRNRTLWAGWVVRTADVGVFFSGDSGYTPHFKEIGRKFGPFDLAAIPIGAYEPRWFMKHHHISPEEAVKAHQDLKARKSVGIHWGTFKLTDEALDAPPKELSVAKQAMGLKQDEFVVLRHGETIAVGDVRPAADSMSTDRPTGPGEPSSSN